jgi:hypothetical protein
MLASLEFFNGDGKPLTGGVKVGNSLKAVIGVRVEHPVANLEACLGFETLSGQRVFTAHTVFEPNRSDMIECLSERTFTCEIPHFILVPGIYKVLVAVGIGDNTADMVEDAAQLEVVDADYYGTGKSPWNGLIVLKHHWHVH